MKSRKLAGMFAVAMVAVLAAPFIGASDAEARQNGKSLKCVARAVPGQVGVRIWTCSNIRV